MKRSVVCSLLAVIVATSVHAADDVLMKAMKLYEKRHFAEAAAILRAGADTLDQARQGTANLTLGMAYLKNAQLHGEMFQAAVPALQDYLKKLAAARGRGRSRFVDFYQGDLLMETGKPGAAAAYFEKFSGAHGVAPRYRSFARVCLGLCYYRNNDPQKALAIWEGIDPADPEVRAELAAAYSKAGLADQDPVSLADGSLAELKRSGKPLSMRALKNIVRVYTASGLTEKGLELLGRADLNGYSYRESLSRTKVVSFYEVALLGDLAALYGKAGVAYLEKAAADPKARDAANFYLGQAYALFGPDERSAKVSAVVLSSPHLPLQFKDRVRVWQGAQAYQQGRAADAAALWGELARKRPEDPDVLAELLFACTRLKAQCVQLAERSAASVEAGDGRKFGGLNVALGQYHLRKKQYAKAVSYLEAGRDKSNKNKIEANEPALLVNLADAYYRTKKFSEALEIYFEMGKQFPEVRQIQEALQGIYAMEHKSAGDVKIN